MAFSILSANTLTVTFLAALACVCVACGYSSYRSQPLTEVPFLERSITKNDRAVRVSAAVLDGQQSNAIFGTPLVKVGIQPVWLRIDNGDTVPYILFSHNVDPNAFSPLEAAYKSHYRFSPAANEKMNEQFVKLSIPKLIPPGAHISGFIYANLGLGVKEVVVTLIGPQRIKSFTFFLSPGGLKTHYDKVNFAALYRPSEIISPQNERELRTALEQLPCCTTNEKGSTQGDPLNLTLIGEAEALLPAFIDRHWDMKEKIYTGSVWREVTAFFFGARYRYAPFSSLYFSGRQCHASKGRPCPQVNDTQADEQSRAHYLAAAVYAYAFLFPEKPEDAVHSPADPRVRSAFDLYNRGLAEGLRSPGGEEVTLVSARYRLPFGELEIQSAVADFSWGGYHFEYFVPTVNLAIRGLRNHYRRPGIGAPPVANLVGVTVAPAVVGANRIPLTLKVPLTTFLRLEAPRHGLSTGALRGQLELYAPDQTETLSINNQVQPLEFDATAALATLLDYVATMNNLVITHSFITHSRITVRPPFGYTSNTSIRKRQSRTGVCW